MSGKTKATVVFYSMLSAVQITGVAIAVAQHSSLGIVANALLLTNWVYKIVRAAKTNN